MFIRSMLLCTALLFSVFAWGYPKTPNINVAPGSLCTAEDKDFEGYRYDERIPYCKRNVSYARKDAICKLYGIYDRTGYTIDHIIPLSAGGSNHDRNLWCQSRSIYTGHIEYWVYKQLRDGKMIQAEAVRYILAHKFNPDGKDHIPSPPSE